MMRSVLITGSAGLIGSKIAGLLEGAVHVIGYDIADRSGDVRDAEALRAAMSRVDGVIHLAAVSRVVWGEKDPATCWEVNAEASRQLLEIACDLPNRPWVLAASSREVYGAATTLPVREDAPIAPVNIYGRAKAAMEVAVHSACARGLRAGIVRFANVYGSADDHADRALPAFCAAAAAGKPLRVDGSDTLFDFTHVEDAACGAMLIAKRLAMGLPTQPIHLLPGRGASLLEVARMAVDAAGTRAPISLAPPRDYDVARFVGDPARARSLLGWRARIPLEDGVIDLVRQFQGRLARTDAP